jgi:hypothetical protein
MRMVPGEIAGFTRQFAAAGAGFRSVRRRRLRSSHAPLFSLRMDEEHTWEKN